MTPLRVAMVTSNAGGNAARIAHHLARSADGVTVVGAIVDRGTAPDRGRQLRRLRAWRRHGGARYALWRCCLELEARIKPQPRESYVHTLHELGHKFEFTVDEVPNVNSAEAEAALRRLEADLAVSIGNRVIHESTFSIPRLGFVNLHHGRIPDYRGGPPGFWEIYRGEPSMGVSVHRIDAQLDHGELLAAAEVPIFEGDDPRTAMERAYTIDYLLVAEAVNTIARGLGEVIPVDFAETTVRTLPSRGQLRRVQTRLGRAIRHDDFRKAPLPELPDRPST